jgi:pterin-4a-carbinolamine dehydratase
MPKKFQKKIPIKLFQENPNMPCYTPESDYKLNATRSSQEWSKDNDRAYDDYLKKQADNKDQDQAILFIKQIAPLCEASEHPEITCCRACRKMSVGAIEAIPGLKDWYLKHLLQDLEKAFEEIKRMNLK